jgi:hypothetical protein
MNDDPTSLYRVPFRRASVTIYTKNFNRLFTRSIERPEPVVPIKPPEQTPEQTAETENAALLFRNMQWKTEPTQRTLRGRFRHIFLPTSRLYLGAAPSSYRAPSLDPQTGEWVIPPPQEDDLEQQFEGQLRAIWSAYSATILTKVKEAQEAGLADILRNILSAQARRRKKRSPGRTISLSTAYQRVSNFLARQGSAAILGTPEAFWKRYSGNSQIRNIVNQIDRVEEQIEAATVPREKLKALVTGLFSGPKTIQFLDTEIRVLTGANTPIPLRALSAGEKHLLRLLVDTVRVEESSIIIDEPELSMHVDWQRSLVASMSQLNPAAQIILASHSPEIMADISDSKIFRL